MVCPACGLRQFESGDGLCRRCYRSLGNNYVEFLLPSEQSSSPAEIRQNVGRVLRVLRARSGLTQGALASRSSIHRTYLSRAECGEVTPSLLTLLRLARAFGG
jgi:DNA-binding XRE family transcriptional regulator